MAIFGPSKISQFLKKIFGGIKYQLTHHKNPEKPHIGLVGSLEANKKFSCWPIDHSER